MTYKKINNELIKQIAIALGELNDQVVYVGGSVVYIYADDPAADDVRSTKDIDVFLEIASYGKMAQLNEKLARKGIYPAPEEGIMCRYKYKDILVDIMTTEDVGLGPAEKWFKPGLKNSEDFEIDGITIKILHVSYFLATKFTAFHDRKEDPRTSRHFEDIVYVLDNRMNLVKEILNSPDDVKEYLVQEFRELLTAKYTEAMLGHLNQDTQTERFRLIKEKLSEIANGV